MDAVSGIFLSALGTDLTVMEEYFPFLSKAFDIMQYTAWAMLFLITVWQLFKAFGGPISESEHPLQLIVVTLLDIIYGRYLLICRWCPPFFIT